MRKICFMFLAGLAMAIVSMTPGSCPAQGFFLHDFDRNACYSTCPCDVRGMISACAECRQECDRKFWADFDKETTEEKVGSMDDDNN